MKSPLILVRDCRISESIEDSADTSYNPDEALSYVSEEEEDEKKEQLSLGKHLRMPKKSVSLEMESVLPQFYEHLIGPDGGKHGKDASKEVVADVRRACFILTADSFSVLFDRNKFWVS